MLGSFKDLPGIIKTAYQYVAPSPICLILTGQYRHLEPGGYFEIQDFGHPARSDDGTLPSDGYIMQWCKLIIEAAANAGRPVYPLDEYKNFLRDAGFEGVVEVQRKWPINWWPRDHKYKELGMWALADIGNGLEGLTMAHFTRGLGWSKEATLAFCANVQRELRDTRIHAYWPMYASPCCRLGSRLTLRVDMSSTDGNLRREVLAG